MRAAGYLIVVLRWTARIVGLLIFGLILMFLPGILAMICRWQRGRMAPAAGGS